MLKRQAPPTAKMSRHFDGAMARLRVRDAKLTHASIVDMLEKTIAMEAKEEHKKNSASAKRRSARRTKKKRKPR